VQIDGPVGLAGAGHADDVEFDTAAERMAFQGVINPDPEFIEGRRGLSKKPIEIHVRISLLVAMPAVAADSAARLLLGLVWLMTG
jgi:hypothetical protein